MKVFVTAKPGAREEKVEATDATHLTVSVTEPPVEGRANRAILETLAGYFKVAPSRVSLVSGFSSRQKIFEIAE